MTGGCGKNHFVDNLFGFFRVLFQIVGESFTYSLVYGSHHFVVS